MSVLWRRFAFGGLRFAIFEIVPPNTCCGIAGSMMSQPTTQAVIQPGKGATRPEGVAAGGELRERYRWRVALGAVSLRAADSVTGVLPSTRRK